MGSGKGSTMRHFIVCTVHLKQSVVKSRRIRWTGHIARMEEGRSSFKILTGKPTEKRLLGRPRRTWEDIITKDHKDTGINMRNWLHFAQDRDYWTALVNASLYLVVP